MKNLSRIEKRSIFRLITATFIFVALFVVDHVFPLYTLTSIRWWLPFLLYLSLFLYVGYDVLLKAFCGLLHGQALDENFLMTVASVSAFVLSIIKGVNGGAPEELGEGVAVLLFYQIGEFFTSFWVNRSRKSIKKVLKLRPDFARIIIDDMEKIVSPSEIKVGDIITVYPGERIALDGVVIKGFSSLDVSSLTGESVPRDVSCEDEVLSGSVVIDGQLFLRVNKPFESSTVSKILDLIENASDKKSDTERFITRFARFYTPVVVLSALFVAIVPSLFTGLWSVWIYRALSFLVVSCPCALVISVPLSFFISLGALSKKGILVKGSNFIEILSQSTTFVFDKTGTLTEGRFSIVDVYPHNICDEVLRLCCIAEHNSSHPIAKSIINESDISYDTTYEHSVVSGLGVIAQKGNSKIACGSYDFLKNLGISDIIRSNSFHTVVYVSENGRFIGYVTLKDKIKDSSFEFINFLKRKGFSSYLLSGDREETVSEVSSSLGIDFHFSSLLPHQKVEKIDDIINNSSSPVCFIGDGINDAPSLTRADVGISMGISGSDASVECSDVVLMKDDLNDILSAIKTSQKTKTVTTQNIVFSLTVKLLILALSILGIANLCVSIFGDVGVLILAVLNSLRCKNIPSVEKNQRYKGVENKSL